MYAQTIGGSDSVGLCVGPCQAPAKQNENVEAELIRLLKTGDEAGFREFIDRYGSRIYRLAYRILRNRQDAEDIAQDVFAEVYISIGNFETRSSLYSWVSRIAINKCYGYLRKKRPIYESEFPNDALTRIKQNAADQRPGVDLEVMQRELINKLLTRLSEEERALLVWREVDGLTVAEISQMTGRNENTIKVKLFRARQRLAQTGARHGGRWHLTRTSLRRVPVTALAK